jgi:hypothetical protein
LKKLPPFSLIYRLLFQRLYNWIKYKTLPSSFLFKNRLFIERDSKHRRIMSNFGLTFRNSKWSNFSMSNIKYSFRTNYFKNIFFFFIFFFILLLFFKFNKFYIINFFFNKVAFFFWLSVDSVDYYLNFLTWTSIVLTTMFFNLFYSYFFFSNFGIKEHKSQKFYNFLKDTANADLRNTNNNIYVSKNDLNWFIYSWLTNSKSLGIKNKLLESFFDSTVNTNWWNLYNSYFIKMYKLVFFLNFFDYKQNLFLLKSKVNKVQINDSNVLYLNNSNILNNYLKLVIWNYLKSGGSYFYEKNKSINLKFFQKRSEWNLFNFNFELKSYVFLLKSKAGLFYFNNFNFEKLAYLIFNFQEFKNLSKLMENQSNVAKWNRWLYRYSLLHRKLLKNSHKITIFKKLINSGIYDSKLFSKNLWISEYFYKKQFQNIYSSLFNLYYSKFFDNKSLVNYTSYNYFLTNNNDKPRAMELLSFYENSYFWFLKRFYSFNTTWSNFTKSNVSINYKNDISKIATYNNYNLNHLSYNSIIGFLLKSRHLNLSQFSDNLLEQPLFLTNFDEKDVFLHLKFNYKDLYTSFFDNEIFSKDNLNIVYWTTLTSSLSDNTSFINYFDFNYAPDSKVLFFKKNKVFEDRYLIKSTSNVDQIFLNDLIYLSMFY